MNKLPAAKARISVDRLTCGLWLAVCTAEPICYEFSKTAIFSRTPEILHRMPVQVFIGLIIASAFAPLLSKGLVIRRVAPALRIWIWVPGVLAASAIWLGWQFAPKSIAQASSTFSIAVDAQTSLGNTRWVDLVALPWWQLLLPSTLIAATVALLPSWILQEATQERWHKFVVVAVAAAVLEDVVEHLYMARHLMVFRWDSLRELESLDWPGRIRLLFLKAGLGAVWGTSALAAFHLLCRGRTGAEDSPPGTRQPGTRALLLAIPFSAMLVPGIQYLMGETGIKAGVPAIRKAFSLTPSGDEYTGEAILAYSSTVQFQPARNPPWASVTFAPDSRSFTLLTENRTLQRIDVETGRGTGQIADPMPPFDHPVVTWSPDGKYLLLETRGAEIDRPNTSIKLHRNRYRLYSLPNLRLVKDSTYTAENCITVMNGQSLFEDDGLSVWMRCENEPTDSQEAQAIQVSVPSMDVLRSFRTARQTTRMTGQDLIRVGGHVWLWQRFGDKSDILFHDLTAGAPEVLTIPPQTQLDRAGTLTPQPLDVDDDQIKLLYCGNSSQVSDPSEADRAPGDVHSFCRTLSFDVKTGHFVGKKDEPNRPVRQFIVSASNKARGLRVDGQFQSSDSRAGDLTVIDLYTKRVRQRIHAIAQRPVVFSPDGRWLLTQASDEGSVRIYRMRAAD